MADHTADVYVRKETAGPKWPQRNAVSGHEFGQVQTVTPTPEAGDDPANSSPKQSLLHALPPLASLILLGLLFFKHFYDNMFTQIRKSQGYKFVKLFYFLPLGRKTLKLLFVI